MAKYVKTARQIAAAKRNLILARAAAHRSRGKTKHGVDSKGRKTTTTTFNIKKEKLIPTLVDIVKTKYNLFGLLKLIFKYLLTGKIRYKPKTALGAVMGMMKLFLIGKNDVFIVPED